MLSTPPSGSLTSSTREHKSYIDILRLFAIVLVVFNHTPAFHFPLGGIGEWEMWMLMMLVSLFTKVAVPIFFMISGGLLLGRHESLGVIFRKRIVRFVLLILLFWAVQCVWCIYQQKNGVDFVTYATSLWSPNKTMIGDGGAFEIRSFFEFSGGITVWFLYAYLGLLLMLPMFRSMVQGMRNAHFVYLVALLIIVGVIIPVVFYMLFGYPPSSYVKNYIPMINNVILPFVLGYFIEYRVNVQHISGRRLACIGCGFLFVALFLSALTYHVRLNFDALQQYEIQDLSWFASYPPILAAFCYILCKKVMCHKLRGKFIRALLMQLGNAVLFLMIVENVLRSLFSQLFGTYSTSCLPSVYVTILTVCLGLILGVIIKQIPLLKRIF